MDQTGKTYYNLIAILDQLETLQRKMTSSMAADSALDLTTEKAKLTEVSASVTRLLGTLPNPTEYFLGYFYTVDVNTRR
jgi:hypothetical protein